MLPQDNPRPPGWFFKFWGMIALLTIFGPLAFPFLWTSKTTSKPWKIMLTVLFTAATIWITIASISIFKKTIEDFRSVGLIR